MPKIAMQPKKLTPEEEVALAVKETLAITKKNDNELTIEEKQYIKDAEKLNVREFPIIFPIRATIGFMVRNMDGKNHQAIEFVRSTIPENSYRTSKNYLLDIVQEFDSLDEDSKNRVDCLDILTRRYNVSPLRFLNAMTEGIAAFHNEMTKALISAKKPELAEHIIKSAKNESLKSAEHKKLAAKMAGLIDDKALVNVHTGDKVTNNTQNNNTVVLSFSDFARANDKIIRGQNAELNNEQREVVEGEIVND